MLPVFTFSVTKKVNMLPFPSDNNNTIVLLQVSHPLGHDRRFHGALTTTYLPHSFIMYRPFPKSCGRQKKYYYLYLKDLRLRELKVTSTISHGFVEMKRLKPTFSNSISLDFTLLGL